MKYAKAIKLARQAGNLTYWDLWQKYGYDINKKKTRTARLIQKEHTLAKQPKKPIGDIGYWYS